MTPDRAEEDKHLKVSPAVHYRVRLAAARRGQTIKQVTEQAIREHLDRHPEPAGERRAVAHA